MTPRAILILVIGLVLAGCASHEPRPVRVVDYGPTFDREGNARSLVLSDPQIAPEPYAWYQDRNDYARSTTVDYDGLVYDTSVRRVYDHLHSHNGRVDDHYHQSQYKQRVRTFAP